MGRHRAEKYQNDLSLSEWGTSCFSSLATSSCFYMLFVIVCLSNASSDTTCVSIFSFLYHRKLMLLRHCLTCMLNVKLKDKLKGHISVMMAEFSTEKRYHSSQTIIKLSSEFSITLVYM